MEEDSKQVKNLFDFLQQVPVQIVQVTVQMAGCSVTRLEDDKYECVFTHTKDTQSGRSDLHGFSWPLAVQFVLSITDEEIEYSLIKSTAGITFIVRT